MGCAPAAVRFIFQRFTPFHKASSFGVRTRCNLLTISDVLHKYNILVMRDGVTSSRVKTITSGRVIDAYPRICRRQYITPRGKAGSFVLFPHQARVLHKEEFFVARTHVRT